MPCKLYHPSWPQCSPTGKYTAVSTARALEWLQAPGLTESKAWMKQMVIVVVSVTELLDDRPAQTSFVPSSSLDVLRFLVCTPSTWRVKENIQFTFLQIIIVCNLTIVWVKLIFLLLRYSYLSIYYGVLFQMYLVFNICRVFLPLHLTSHLIIWK